MEFIPSSEMKSPKSGFLLIKYWVGWVWQSLEYDLNEWNYYLLCEQFQFGDSMLFGQVR